MEYARHSVWPELAEFYNKAAALQAEERAMEARKKAMRQAREERVKRKDWHVRRFYIRRRRGWFHYQYKNEWWLPHPLTIDGREMRQRPHRPPELFMPRELPIEFEEKVGLFITLYRKIVHRWVGPSPWWTFWMHRHILASMYRAKSGRVIKRDSLRRVMNEAWRILGASDCAMNE